MGHCLKQSRQASNIRLTALPVGPEGAAGPIGTFGSLELLEQSGASSPGLRTDPKDGPGHLAPCWGRFFDSPPLLGNGRFRPLVA